MNDENVYITLYVVRLSFFIVALISKRREKIMGERRGKDKGINKGRNRIRMNRKKEVSTQF
jgi:hypothetical protein